MFGIIQGLYKGLFHTRIAGFAIGANRLNSPYMTDYSDATDCTGTMKGFNIYITSGTGAGGVGLIRAGPDK